MRVPFYDIKAQYDELRGPLDDVVHEVISSGNYMMGAHMRGIEEGLAALHRVKHGIALNSGTDALRILLDAAGVGPGDEVITTAFTFVATVETIIQTGATPVFVDIDPATFDLDPSLLEAAITSKTKVIMPIHLFGQMAPMEEIKRIADAHGIAIIEDAAQALGCERNGKPAAHFGLGAGLSFYVTKNLGAAGDAGMIITDSDEIAEKCRSMRVHGMGRERYYYDYVGYTSRMDEVQAAVLRVKLTKLAEWNSRRGMIAGHYLDELQETGLQLPSTREGNNNTWHQFSVLTPRRDELMEHLKAAGVDSMIYYPVPLHHHKPYLRFAKPLPVTERVSREIVNLPIHPHLEREAVQHVCDSIQSFPGN